LSRRSESLYKQLLLDRLDTSHQQLRNVEGILQSEIVGKRVISFRDCIMADLARREIWRGNEKISLTPTEWKLFQVLIENHCRVMMH